MRYPFVKSRSSVPSIIITSDRNCVFLAEKREQQTWISGEGRPIKQLTNQQLPRGSFRAASSLSSLSSYKHPRQRGGGKFPTEDGERMPSYQSRPVLLCSVTCLTMRRRSTVSTVRHRQMRLERRESGCTCLECQH